MIYELISCCKIRDELTLKREQRREGRKMEEGTVGESKRKDRES